MPKASVVSITHFFLAGGLGEKALSEYQVHVAEHYASKDFLLELKRELTASIRDVGRRIDHVFHPNRD